MGFSQYSGLPLKKKIKQAELSQEIKKFIWPCLVLQPSMVESLIHLEFVLRVLIEDMS